MARNLTDPFDGFFLHCTHCIMDNDKIFSSAFKKMLTDFGTKPTCTVIKTPNMNSYCERYIGSYQREVLNWVISQSEEYLRKFTLEWLMYYNSERNHQGIHRKIINPGVEIGQSKGCIKMRSRLGGILHYYYREAA